MTVKAAELKKMIREIVAEEVARQLPSVLSEMYLKRIVSEHAAGRQTRGGENQQSPEPPRRHLRELLDDEPEAPRPAETRELVRERIKKAVLEEPSNPFAALYEGVSHMTDPNDGGASPTETQFGPGGIPLSMLGFDPEKINAAVSRRADKGPMQETPEMKMKRLEEHRRRLDSARVG